MDRQCTENLLEAGSSPLSHSAVEVSGPRWHSHPLSSPWPWRGGARAAGPTDVMAGQPLIPSSESMTASPTANLRLAEALHSSSDFDKLDSPASSSDLGSLSEWDTLTVDDDSEGYKEIAIGFNLRGAMAGPSAQGPAAVHKKQGFGPRGLLQRGRPVSKPSQQGRLPQQRSQEARPTGRVACSPARNPHARRNADRSRLRRAMQQRASDATAYAFDRLIHFAPLTRNGTPPLHPLPAAEPDVPTRPQTSNDLAMAATVPQSQMLLSSTTSIPTDQELARSGRGLHDCEMQGGARSLAVQEESWPQQVTRSAVDQLESKVVDQHMLGGAEAEPGAVAVLRWGMRTAVRTGSLVFGVSRYSAQVHTCPGTSPQALLQAFGLSSLGSGVWTRPGSGLTCVV